jgi:hypothetical protein
VPRPPVVNPDEKFLTVAEVAEQLQLDRHHVTRLFSAEPDVLIFGNPETKKSLRKYRLIRIPQAAVARVLARHRGKG